MADPPDSQPTDDHQPTHIEVVEYTLPTELTDDGSQGEHAELTATELDENTEITLVVADEASDEPPMAHEIEISTFTSAEAGDVYYRKSGSFVRAGPGTSTPRPHTAKPSLLRRSRGIANNPLLNQSYVVAGPSEEASVVPVSLKDEPTYVTTTEEPEIVIWQPDPNDTCEIIEVQESDLASFLQQKTGGDGNIQQIIVCGEEGDTEGMDFTEMFQNYMFEVQPAPEETPTPAPKKAAKKKAKKKPRPPKPVPLGPDGLPVEKKGKNITELKCKEADCNHYSNNVQEMRKHLQNEHSVPMDEENIHFATEDDFKRWRAAYERDRRVSFIYRGGTKKISPDRAVTYLICHRSGTYKPAMSDNTRRLRKMKPQGSCKIGTYCTAGIKLLKQLNTGIVEATICHTHYGHELDNVQHLRISQAMKNILVQKFDEGLTFGQVLQYVHHNPDGLEGFKLIDRRAIRNVYDQWRKPTKRDSTEDPIPIITISADGTVETDDQGNKMDTCEDGEVDTEVEKKIQVDVGLQELDVKVKAEPDMLDSETLVAESESPKTSAPPKKRRTATPRNRKTTNSEEITPGTRSEKTGNEGVSGDQNSETASTEPINSTPDSPDVDSAMEKLLEHGESGGGPTVLLYKKTGEIEPHTGDASPLLKKHDLCMILQTPTQRQLLQMFGKVINLELVEGHDMDVLAMVVLDDFLMAIPVAWLVCNQVSEGMIKNFFEVIHKNCVEIKCDFLFSTKKSDLQRIWCESFEKKPRILYPQEDVMRELKALLRRHFDDSEKRMKCFEILETLVTTPDKTKFFDTCNILRSVTQNRDFERLFIHNWYGERDKWAFHARTQVHTVMEDSFAKLRKFILFKGTKSLGRNIDSILKIGYDKCFQHNKNLFKGDIKVKTLVEQIDEKHVQYEKYDWSVERVGENKFKMSLDNMVTPDLAEVFELLDLNTVCTCLMRCKICDVCIHRFWCSCGDQNFCMHAHALRLYLAIQEDEDLAEDEQVALFLAEEEEQNPFQDFEDEEANWSKSAATTSASVTPVREVKPKSPMTLSARKMKTSTRKSTTKKEPEVKSVSDVKSPPEPKKAPEENKTTEPATARTPTPVPILILNSEQSTPARRSTRIQKTNPEAEDSSALRPTTSANSVYPASRKRRSAAQIEVVPIPIPVRKLRKVKAEPESEPEEPESEPEPELKPVVRGRGRPRKSEPTPTTASTSKSTTPKATTELPRRPRNSVPLPLLASFRKKRGEYDETDTSSLRSELLTLVNQIDRIKSARVLKDVKKRISELSTLVNDK